MFTPATFATPIPTANETAGVSFDAARATYEKFVAHYKNAGHDITPHRVAFVTQGANRDDWYRGPVLCHNFDDNEAWAIVWEEGPWEWVYDDMIFRMGNDHGIYAEPVNTFSIRFYPEH